MTYEAYATEEDLAEWLPSGTDVSDGPRLLKRASQLLDATVTTPFCIDSTTGLPTDTTYAEAMRDACCAQIEFWLDVGEEHDIEGLTGGVAIGSLRLDRLPPKLAPRARQALVSGGLMAMAADVGVPVLW